MSYARFGWEGSDVYVYTDIHGYICCCGCIIDRGENDAVGWKKLYSTDDALAHLDEHRRWGHCVPEDCYDGLREDRVENDTFIAARQDHPYEEAR